jgi:hypothetical protein
MEILVLLEKVNQDQAVAGYLPVGLPEGRVQPVMATPALIATPAVAKAAGFVVGAGAVGGAAYAAYKAVAS